MKVEIFSIAYDTTENGTGVWLFGSKDERNKTLVEIMETVEGEECEADNEIRLQMKECIANGEISEAWDMWEDNFRGHLDTYNLDESVVDIPTDDKGVPVVGKVDEP